jgi:hypothetical protein
MLAVHYISGRFVLTQERKGRVAGKTDPALVASLVNEKSPGHPEAFSF